jgi:undecaprenyl-diphosphatase
MFVVFISGLLPRSRRDSARTGARSGLNSASEFLNSEPVALFDAKVDAAFEPLRQNATANRVFYGLSEAANHSILWHMFGWSRALLFRSRRRDAIELTAALAIESALVNGPVKMLFRRERPETTEERPHKLREPLTSSFPSGHATSAFCAAVLLSRRSKFTPFYFVAAAFVAVSRIHVKIHHASDVVGGAVIGTGLGLLAKQLLRGISQK